MLHRVSAVLNGVVLRNLAFLIFLVTGCSADEHEELIGTQAPRLVSGAVGNGVTDDTAAIQSALDAAAALAGGGRVTLQAGTFRITSTLLIGSNTTFEGQGPSTIIRRDPSHP